MRRRLKRRNSEDGKDENTKAKIENKGKKLPKFKIKKDKEKNAKSTKKEIKSAVGKHKEDKDYKRQR